MIKVPNEAHKVPFEAPFYFEFQYWECSIKFDDVDYVLIPEKKKNDQDNNVDIELVKKIIYYGDNEIPEQKMIELYK